MPLSASLARLWTRLQRAVLPGRVELIYSPRYQLRLGGTPIDSARGEKILSYLLDEGLAGRRNTRTAKRVSIRALAAVHTEAYLEQLHKPEALVPIVGFSPGDAAHERALEAQRFAVGGTCTAIRLALQRNRIVYNLGGGFHHAHPDSGRGFCIFNDIAVAITRQRLYGFDGRVLIIDLDLHDGDGTRAVFAEDASVFTFSIHNRHWNESSAVASESIELEGEVEDDEYLALLSDRIPRLIEQVQPELVLLVAGTDPAHDDPLGNWRISDDGMLARDQIFFSALEESLGEIPVVVTLAGGYGNSAWRHTARTISWLVTGSVIEPPSSEDLTLARYRGLLGQLVPSDLREQVASFDSGVWNISGEDIFGDLMGEKRSSRLLGHYSRHGVELILERCGLMSHLRELGYRRPHLEFDLTDPAGETVRIFGTEKRRHLLVEVRLRIDSRAAPTFNLLSIEWLLMQNPKLKFRQVFHRLPGQSHPGLGLLNEMMALLMVMSEKLELDGILFVPAHYHLATKGKRYLKFVEPEDEAYFQALQGALDGLHLAHATQAVEEGRVVDASGQTAGWRPMPMTLALSDRLKRQVTGEEYERKVREEKESLNLKLGQKRD